MKKKVRDYLYRVTFTSAKTTPDARPWAAGAMDIEALLIWAYRDQRVDVLDGQGRGLSAIERAAAGEVVYGRSADGCARIEDIARVGCEIDYSGSDLGRVHEVALAVHDVVRALGVAHVVIPPARAARRPVWHYEGPGLLPMYDGGGRPLVEEWAVEGQRGRGARYCPCICPDGAAHLAARRAAWIDWWEAVMAVQRAVESLALPFLLLPWMADREPWVSASRGDLRKMHAAAGGASVSVC